MVHVLQYGIRHRQYPRLRTRRHDDKVKLKVEEWKRKRASFKESSSAGIEYLLLLRSCGLFELWLTGGCTP